VWGPLFDLLERHATAEEETFYPELLALDKENPEEETEDAIRDHNKIRDAVRDAEFADTGSEAWWKAIEATQTENDDHMREEEEGPLPHFRKYVDDATRERIGAEFEARKRGEPFTGDRNPKEYVEQHEPHDVTAT
ncbi:MAG: hemerythrin domain-containing protein, partial [Candidatus Dormibacteria bacterium]